MIIHPVYTIYPQSTNSKILTNDDIVTTKRTNYTRSSDTTFTNSIFEGTIGTILESNLLTEKEYYQYIYSNIFGNPIVSLFLLPLNFKFEDIKYYDGYLSYLAQNDLEIIFENNAYYIRNIITGEKTIDIIVLKSSNKLLMIRGTGIDYIIGIKEIISTDVNCKINSKDFLYTSNETYVYDLDDPDPIYISRVGLYDSSNRLISISTLSQPVKKLDSDFNIVININNYNE